MTWSKRKTVSYTIEQLPTDETGKVVLIDPSAVKVFIPGYKYAVDIGSWCYTERKRIDRASNTDACASFYVDKQSYRVERLSFICGYLDYLKNHLALGKSPNTLKTAVGQFQTFVEWCNKNYVSCFDAKEHYVQAVHMFSEEKISLIRKSKININTAATMQLVVITVGRGIYHDPYGDLFRFVRRIRRSYRAVNRTVVPEDVAVSDSLKVYMQLFTQLSDFVLKFEMYPKKVYVGDEYFWCFPSSIPFAGPSSFNQKNGLNNKFIAYDYIGGRVRTLEEIAFLSSTNNSCSHKASYANAENNIRLANEDRFHRRRVDAATMAIQSFIMLFSANTGMNLGQIIDLPYEGDYRAIKSKMGFKSIKYRAGGRDVIFHISSWFYVHFKKYLLLRRYLLEAAGRDVFSFLFVTCTGGELKKIGMNLSTYYHNRLKACFNIDEKITTRMWRAYKGDWLIRNTDVSTSAMLMQNSPITILRHYSEGSESKNSSEISQFFDEYKHIISGGDQGCENIPVGHCAQRAPKLVYNSAVKPDCKSFEGCLFCENYRIVADKNDYHKLLSFKYILSEVRTIAFSEEHFINVIQPVIMQIDVFLDVIKRNYKGSILDLRKIERSVSDAEILYEYWQEKLLTLIDIGALS